MELIRTRQSPAAKSASISANRAILSASVEKMGASPANGARASIRFLILINEFNL